MSANRITYPDALEIVPLNSPPSTAVSMPGSKSITNRALVLAALCSARPFGCYLTDPLVSEDTEVMIECLRRLGFQVDVLHGEPASLAQVRQDLRNCGLDLGEVPDVTVRVSRPQDAPVVPASEADLFVANSGTTMRFLTAFVSLGNGRYRLDGVPRMRERPIEDLLTALRQLGVCAYSERGNGCPPVVVEARGLNGGQVRIKGDRSSQFLSGLLLAAPCARDWITIRVEGQLVSWPYVLMTVELMRQFGITVHATCDSSFLVPAPQQFCKDRFHIEPDASAASYFFAAAAITGGRVTVLGLPENSLQGDVRFVDLLADMGCRVERCSSGITVHGRPLHGIDVDMNDISDTVMTLAAVACFAEGPTTIRNVAHIRYKETDRLAALAAELRRLGAGVEEFADGLTITPRPLHGAVVETYNDHRMAMSLALVGLRVPGVVIKNPGCVAKTYPNFFDDLEKLRQHEPPEHRQETERKEQP
ncbi:MAG TPA: 3-phosphoshikimate 1-carboxyvinyltransferase [Gemmataceae bacterium]|nr:3-phosphoshikimate 1-carboxyvinyltransferase [Gemmataceae bacterium]